VLTKRGREVTTIARGLALKPNSTSPDLMGQLLSTVISALCSA
jgi:hypothetical protein